MKFVSKKENIDTLTPIGKFILTVFGAIAELERNYILDRQSEGIASAKKETNILGNPKSIFLKIEIVFIKNGKVKIYHLKWLLKF